MNYTDLPALNASLNSLATVLLTAGFIFIKRGNQIAHRNCMIAALVVSTLFLVSYLGYHYQMKLHHGEAHTKFVNPPEFRPVYLAILFTHLVGAFVIVPLVLITTTRAFKQRFEAHKRIARWTWPIWMYVSVTGVIIYLMLYQVFPQTPK